MDPEGTDGVLGWAIALWGRNESSGSSLFVINIGKIQVVEASFRYILV